VRLHVPEFVEPKSGRRIAQTNPAGYPIWGGLQQLVYRRRRIRDVQHLKEVVQTCWQQIGQDVIDCAIGQFRKQLSLVVATCGGHIEQRLTNVLGATRTLSYLCFVVEMQNSDNKSKQSGLFCATLRGGRLLR